MKQHFFDNKIEIENWLNHYGIKNYTINSNLTVDVNDYDVMLYDKGLTHLPVQFNKVVGDFCVNNNQLISLLGSPKIVRGDFSCVNNPLTSLIGGPIDVRDSYFCSRCQLTTLEGAPKELDSFDCSNNQLTNLLHSPHLINECFDCSHNHITSLEGSPHEVRELFRTIGNNIQIEKKFDLIIYEFKHLAFTQDSKIKVFNEYYKKTEDGFDCLELYYEEFQKAMNKVPLIIEKEQLEDVVKINLKDSKKIKL
jgi:Leucine-rich repeat (LRR) protein